MLTKTALKKLDYALVLINESRKNINDTINLLNKKSVSIRPLPPRQGELFLDNPLHNEELSRLCLGALVETITGLSDIGNPRPAGADKTYKERRHGGKEQLHPQSN
jgi:hypothetical protein